MPESNAGDGSLGLSEEWLEKAGFKWHQLDRHKAALRAGLCRCAGQMPGGPARRPTSSWDD
jgi:hypothetical protein